MKQLIDFRDIYFKDATKYTQAVGKWSQAVLEYIDEAILSNNQMDEDGWVYIGDILKRFNDNKKNTN